MADVTLRPARPQDAPLLRRWDEEPHILAADPHDDWQWETELERSPPWRELIAEVDGRPVGFVQIIDPAHRFYGVPRGRAAALRQGRLPCLPPRSP